MPRPFRVPALSVLVVGALLACGGPGSQPSSDTDAVTQRLELPVIEGQCRYEGTGETFRLRAVDPLTHFGMIAAGVSPRGDEVSLSINATDAILVDIQGQSAATYAVIPRAATGPTKIETGIYLQGTDGRRQWMSCDLSVRL